MIEDSRTRILTKHLKGIEAKLYAVRDEQTHVIHVMREAKELAGPYEYDGMTFMASISSPNFIFALTDNWTSQGKPRDWGIDPVLNRIREIDSWNRSKMFDEMRAQREETDKRNERTRINNHEAWLRDNKMVFRDAFKDINTSSLNNREKEREIKTQMELKGY